MEEANVFLVQIYRGRKVVEVKERVELIEEFREEGRQDNAHNMDER